MFNINNLNIFTMFGRRRISIKRDIECSFSIYWKINQYRN